MISRINEETADRLKYPKRFLGRKVAPVVSILGTVGVVTRIVNGFGQGRDISLIPFSQVPYGLQVAGGTAVTAGKEVATRTAKKVHETYENATKVMDGIHYYGTDQAR